MARRDLTGAVDFGHLERYTAGDAGLISEVLGLFRQQTELWLPLLQPDAPSESWKDAAHSLKGSALGVGAFALAEACDGAETGAGSGPAARAVQLDAIRDAVDAALADVAAYQHEQALQSLRSPPRSASQRPNS
jgi:HPt (histidine-containing phosphotransfer) domain-containing protein